MQKPVELFPQYFIGREETAPEGLLPRRNYPCRENSRYPGFDAIGKARCCECETIPTDAAVLMFHVKHFLNSRIVRVPPR